MFRIFFLVWKVISIAVIVQTYIYTFNDFVSYIYKASGHLSPIV